mmetsp:Transcript_49940/g.83735  ORF Transcript_49940/g.83735 Transcript_49940/m.83735 type:complete len:179 (+) Transcript_49940:37-573(+)|eukprot:CAMPEP_0174289278 /NCGR_PEP_ID=MMETSP0809-20121228/24425_1 /TAXON_ID=73025 ORGANISM="Eutreptiella gymnastica-like, Strain CCMP1594" /NCGR_SAMPLE_ID=MMETSP0809 /ASSEMBLY_ACC=CAM_ASM_000658 /LENGTH=178 /DNA_ID=CAMNT_0015387137 /DNA_START=38 /DNA_END=574 /DNA_ORIENTATION=+
MGQTADKCCNDKAGAPEAGGGHAAGPGKHTAKHLGKQQPQAPKPPKKIIPNDDEPLVITAYKEHFDCDLIDSEHKLFNVKLGDVEYQFMDVRENHVQNVPEGRVALEMFWEGELKTVPCVEAFHEAVLPKLGMYDTVELLPKMREGGCMISMVVLGITLTEREAMALGNRLFKNFCPL